MWIAFKTRLDCSQSILLVLKIVGAMVTVTTITEFTIGKTIAVPGGVTHGSVTLQLQQLQNSPLAKPLQYLVVLHRAA